MKKITKSLLLPALLLVLFACENNTEDLNIGTEQNGTLLKKGLSASSTLTAEEQFQNTMQWISFLTAEAILNDSGARSEFIASLNPITFISPSRKVILNDLFTANNPEFMAAFESTFIFYETNNWNHSNDPDCGKPSGGRPMPPPTGGIDDTCTSISDLYCKFKHAITNLYCLEFYLPTGYQTNQIGTSSYINITSSAHPLNNTNSNYSYTHPGCQIGDNIINNSNFTHYTNPIIVRPYVSPSSPICSFNEYESIGNFTDFLHN